jgi:ClpP class serine protease
MLGSIGVISGTYWINKLLEKNEIKSYSVTNNE